MDFDNCIYLCYFQPNKDIEHFSYPRKFSYVPLQLLYTECLCPPNILEILILHVMVLRGGPLVGD